MRLGERLSTLRKGSMERQEVDKKRKALLKRLREQEIQRVREEWDRRQAVDDIERQVQGKDFAPHAERAKNPISPAQARMFSALEAPLVNDIDAQFKRRTEAIEALVAYCNIEEPLRTKVLEAREPPPPRELVMVDPMEQARQFRASVIGEVYKVSRCFICVARALTLRPDDINLPNLTHEFYSHQSLCRHFYSVHLDFVDVNNVMDCPICVPLVRLTDMMHLRSHAETVHGIKTETWKKKQRRT